MPYHFNPRHPQTRQTLLEVASSANTQELIQDLQLAAEKRIEVAMTCVPEETKKIEQATPAPSKIKSGPAKTKLCKFSKKVIPVPAIKGMNVLLLMESKHGAKKQTHQNQ